MLCSLGISEHIRAESWILAAQETKPLKSCGDSRAEVAERRVQSVKWKTKSPRASRWSYSWISTPFSYCCCRTPWWSQSPGGIVTPFLEGKGHQKCLQNLMFHFKLELHKYVNGEKNLLAKPEDSSTFCIPICSALPSGEEWLEWLPDPKQLLYSPFQIPEKACFFFFFSSLCV